MAVFLCCCKNERRHSAALALEAAPARAHCIRRSAGLSFHVLFLTSAKRAQRTKGVDCSLRTSSELVLSCAIGVGCCNVACLISAFRSARRRCSFSCMVFYWTCAVLLGFCVSICSDVFLCRQFSFLISIHAPPFASMACLMTAACFSSSEVTGFTVSLISTSSLIWLLVRSTVCFMISFSSIFHVHLLNYVT